MENSGRFGLAKILNVLFFPNSVGIPGVSTMVVAIYTTPFACGCLLGFWVPWVAVLEQL